VKSVTVEMWKYTNLSGIDEHYFSSTIKFENEGTSATQEIKGCSDMTDAFLKAAEFVKSLND
jgi:hypothetical protein